MQRGHNFAKQHNIKIVISSYLDVHNLEHVPAYDALLDDPVIDCVYIAVPTALRKQYVLEAAKKGKHVLCERPIALNLSDAQEMVAACAEADVQLMDGVQFMHHPRLDTIMRVLRGEVTSVELSYNFPVENIKENIRGNPDLEPHGCIGTLGYDCVRFIIWAFNLQTPCAVTCSTMSETDEGIPLHSSATLRFLTGMASFSCSFLSAPAQIATIRTDMESVRINDFVFPFQKYAAFEVHKQQYGSDYTDFPQCTIQRHECEGLQTQLMVDAMNESATEPGILDPFWPQVAVQTQFVIDALLKSAQYGGRWVPLEANRSGTDSVDYESGAPEAPLETQNVLIVSSEEGKERISSRGSRVVRQKTRDMNGRRSMRKSNRPSIAAAGSLAAQVAAFQPMPAAQETDELDEDSESVESGEDRVPRKSRLVF
jgi:predicted dehydrogenase